KLLMARRWRPAAALWRRLVTPGPLAVSLDHLVGAAEDRLWDRQAERLGGLEVDDQLEFRRLLDREVRRFGALQDLVDIVRRDSEHVGKTRPIRHQKAGPGGATANANRGQTVAQRHLGSPRPVERRTRYDQRIAATTVGPGQGILVIIGRVAQLDCGERNAEC